ncbi:MAG: ABC transporter ATP-binding protein, partial [Oscillospiraceae bacterium]
SHIIVPYQDMTVQQIIARLKSPLTVLKIREPSLEDAYVEYSEKGGR